MLRAIEFFVIKKNGMEEKYGKYQSWEMFPDHPSDRHIIIPHYTLYRPKTSKKYVDDAEHWMDPEYDTQFRDIDPRGWNTENPWQEFRQQLEAKTRRRRELANSI